MLDRLSPPQNPLWLPHRYDAANDRLHFIPVTRQQHREATFLIDALLPQAQKPTVMARETAMAQAAPAGPLHFLFHSAFCCSTLLVRALDREGYAMGMSEPVILNDIIGWRHRGKPQPQQVATVIQSSLDLLARPFSASEAVIIKPSNLVNPLATAFMALRPNSRAILLHAPLDAFLGSIARKGLEGRVWVRDLYAKLLREGLAGFGMEPVEQLKLTDIQVAAVCWLAQQQLFAGMVERFGDRVRTLNSETLMDTPALHLKAAGLHYGLNFGADDIADILAGPAFNTHSKSGQAFSGKARQNEREQGLKTYADEINKVGIWARQVADMNHIPMILPNALV